ncbi:MAG: hypothetical protein R3B40_09400 [Polyangiales bacterium]
MTHRDLCVGQGPLVVVLSSVVGARDAERDPALTQRCGLARAFGASPGGGELGPGLRERSAGPARGTPRGVEVALGVDWVESEEDLALFDGLAFFNQDLHHLAGDPGVDVDLAMGLDRACDARDLGHRLSRRRHATVVDQAWRGDA